MNIRSVLSRWAIASLLVLSSALGGCGGGGAGGGSTAGASPSPAPSTTNGAFSVSIDRAQLSFDSDEGNGAMPQAVLGSGTGALPAAIYTGALDLGTSLDHVTAEVIGAQIKFTVYPKANLPAGQYKGAVQLFACVDAKCAQHFAGSPTNVDYTVTVRKGLKVTPTPLSLTALSGAVLTRDMSVQLPDNASTYTVSSSASWISAGNVTSSGFTLTTAPLAPGYYQATVTVATTGRSVDIPVTYGVKSDATTVTEIKLDTTSLDFSATSSLAASPRQINVTLPSWTTELSSEVQYYGDGKGWLTVTKSGATQLIVTASAVNLAPGNYYAQILVKTGYPAVPASVPVNFTVGTPTWQIAGKYAFSIDGNTRASDLASEVAIATPNLPGQTWTANTSSSWLKLVNTSGATGSSTLRVAVDLGEMAKLPNFETTSADVTIAAASGKIAPAKLTFTLDKRLPEVNFVSPYARLPGESGPVIVRGRGFDSVPDLPGSLVVNGAAVQGITRVNDTQLVVQLGGVSQGDTTIAMKNGLAQATNTSRIKIVPARSYGYSAIKTAGVKGIPLYDAERQAVYVTNKTLGTLMRFSYNNGNWNVDTANVPAIEAVALAPDGSTIVVTATSGKVVLFNPDDLSLQATYTNDSGHIGGNKLGSHSTMGVLNDGKAVFQGSIFPATGIPYFDLVTRKFGALPTPASYGKSYEPALNVSGDGSRLLSGYPSDSPLDGLFYADAADGVVKINGGGISYWIDGVQSLHGDRLTDSVYEVYDRDFSLVGYTILTGSGYYGRASVLSPDGKRLYLLAYSESNLPARVFVFDSSTKSLTTTSLPIIGYFDLADYPSCRPSDCTPWPLGTISPDGKTLFFVGDLNLVVAPVPGTLTTASGAPARVQQARMGAQVIPDQMVRHTLRQ